MYSREETAELLGIHVNTLDSYRRQHLIRGYQAVKGSTVRYTEDAINEFIMNMMDAPVRKPVVTDAVCRYSRRRRAA